jgi:hypothetical protein
VDVRDLEAFAAERQHVVAAAVSQRIGSLEDELGLVLFDRTSGRVGVTTGGVALGFAPHGPHAQGRKRSPWGR